MAFFSRLRLRLRLRLRWVVVGGVVDVEVDDVVNVEVDVVVHFLVPVPCRHREHGGFVR